MADLLSYDDALELISELSSERKAEIVPLERAHGRAVITDIPLSEDQPPFDRATMDGFAVMLNGDQAAFSIVGMVAAGSTFEGVLQPGQAVRIMTGAPVPSGTTVVPIELTDQLGRSAPHASLTHKTLTTSVVVQVTDPKGLTPKRNIAFQGEDGRAGDIVIRAGTILGPATLACAAMAGARQLTVARPPLLAIVTTGDEVGGSGAAAINDSNGPFLAAFAAALGVSTVRSHAVDDAIALRAALVNSFDQVDLVVTTGGVSAGDKDLVPVLAASLGLTTIFHHLAIQPGKPVFLARRGDGKILVGLPGNPVSVIATAHLILLPVIRRLMGLPPAGTWEALPLSVSWSNPGKRRLFLPARRTAGGVMPIKWNGSGDLVAAAAGDCLVDLAPGASHPAGHELPVLPYVGTPIGATAVLPKRCR